MDEKLKIFARPFRVRLYYFKAVKEDITAEDMQKIVDANEKLVREMKDGNK